METTQQQTEQVRIIYGFTDEDMERLLDKVEARLAKRRETEQEAKRGEFMRPKEVLRRLGYRSPSVLTHYEELGILKPAHKAGRERIYKADEVEELAKRMGR